MSLHIEETRSVRKQSMSSLFSAAQEALPPPVHFESLRFSEEQIKLVKNKKVRDFYKVSIGSGIGCIIDY